LALVLAELVAPSLASAEAALTEVARMAEQGDGVAHYNRGFS
jgi:hypothetical protein